MFFSFDATKGIRIGRNINDSGKMCLNSVLKKILVKIVVKTDIDGNTEIRYDYGERSSVLPWRKDVC